MCSFSVTATWAVVRRSSVPLVVTLYVARVTIVWHFPTSHAIPLLRCASVEPPCCNGSIEDQKLAFHQPLVQNVAKRRNLVVERIFHLCPRNIVHSSEFCCMITSKATFNEHTCLCTHTHTLPAALSCEKKNEFRTLLQFPRMFCAQNTPGMIRYGTCRTYSDHTSSPYFSAHILSSSLWRGKKSAM